MPPLRWGDAPSRAVAGGILIISGAIAVAGADTFVLWLLLLGTIVHIAGWCIMPSSGWRRVVAVAVSTPAVLLLLTGPRFIGVLVLPYVAWLLVRHRPGRSYPTLLFVLAAAVILPRLFPDYSGMLPALCIELAVIAASAWVARAVARRGDSRSLPRNAG
ncbi:hypothetical protein BH10ACT6_BH10ACT6_14730 [soil metagenome]